MLVLLFLPQAMGYEVFPCDYFNNSYDCQRYEYCSWCVNETDGFCNEYPICSVNNLNCTKMYHNESCSFFNMIYFLLIFSIFFILTYLVGNSLMSITYFGLDGEKRYKPVIVFLSVSIFISGIIIYFFKRKYLIYYSIIISTILIFSAIVYYLNIKNQRALRSLGVSYLPVAGIPPPYSEDNDENDDENITNA